MSDQEERAARFVGEFGGDVLPAPDSITLGDAVRDALGEVDAFASSAAMLRDLPDADRAAILRIADDLLIGPPGAAEEAPVYAVEAGAVAVLPGADYLIPYAATTEGVHVAEPSSWVRMSDTPVAKAAPDEPPDEATRLTLITRLERVLAAALASQAGRVADALREAGAADAMRQALAALWSGEREALTRAVLPVLDEIVAAGLESGAGALPFAADWGLVNEAALQLARERAAVVAATATATTEAQVAQVVADWVATGGTLDDLIDRWQAVSGNTRRRAEVGAVTTVTDLYAQANRQAWAESGLVEGYESTGANDERVCPVCSAKHGEYPISDLDNLPPYHPRCRCWILAVTKK